MIGKADEVFIVKPFGIVARNNTIYVSDLGTSSLKIIDLETNTIEKYVPFGEPLQMILNCFVDKT